MTTKELYTKGARIWVANPETVWEGAQVLVDYSGGTELQIVLDSGGQVALKVAPNTLPPLRNPEILIGENDLTSLSYLHEPAVLHNLKVRFCDLNAIYTYCGIVLVAINPYDDLPIYGEETILAYRGQAMGDLDPHIFAVSEEAYTKLEREHKDQSIIVSGESGAGKTVSAKYAMRYFAAVGGSSSETHVERKVLASSPIMEAIGNAKTTRNDNSSRFGKFIEINFSRTFHIMGASMRTYLLEKSRVVFQAPGERNYHVFYQLCSVRDTMPHLMLTDCTDFHFLNQGRDPIIDGVDDSNMFQETKQALNTLGFTEGEQRDMFIVLAAILHLGNVNIFEGHSDQGRNDTSSETSQISPQDRHLLSFCKLCGVDPSRLISRLTHRTLVSRSEVIESPLNCVGAKGARDALAKHLYAQLFSWLVSGANRSLKCAQPTHHRIGVLDIYGFETFEINSFEQFCINYANEKLQQQFNQHVFKLEQEEYLREDITWKMIEFHDNQPCIELIEAKLGVLDLLDEECRVPQGSDASWANKLHQKCAHSPHYAAPRFQSEAFVIKHFADDVMYMTMGFLEKNRDTVLEDQVELLRAGALGLLRELCSPSMPDTLGVPTPAARVKISPNKPIQNTNAMTKQHKQTVGAQFRASLTALMTSLNSTTPHYVRCIKPNDLKKPFQYNPARAVQQLRACGVLETIRISAAGFPSRWLYAEFYLRYRVLCHSKAINRSDHRKTCSNIVNNCIKDEDKYKFGKTKIFFRAGQVAYLEKLRAERLRRCCIIMQSQLRAYVARKKYLRIRQAIEGIQRHARGYLARKLACELRRQRSAKTIQRHVRGWLQRTRYARLRRTAIGLQARGRGLLARRRVRNVRKERAAITIQRYLRGFLARRRCTKKRQQIIICQAAIRRFLARRQYKRLRAEARSVEHVKKLNRGLENKIITLQQKLGDLQVENRQIGHLHQEVIDLKAKLEPMKSLEAQLKELKIALMERDNRIVMMDEQLALERESNMELVHERDSLKKMHKKEKEEWEYDSAKIAKELISLKESNTVNQKDSEQKLREQYELEKRELISELDKEKRDYQRLLIDLYKLQAKLDELKEESNNKSHKRSLSNASNASQQEEDNGYGSVKSTQSSNVQVTLEAADSEKDQGDAGLIIRLQRRVQRLTEEKDFLSKRIANLENSSPKAGFGGARPEDQIRIEELEIENTRLSTDLNRLRTSVAMSDGDDISRRELAEQFVSLQEELDRRRDECIQLRGVLASQRPWFQALKDVSVNLKSLATSNYANNTDMSIINEDGELVQAFEAQKKITKQLEEEVKLEKDRYSKSLSDYVTEIDRLREENEKQQRMLTSGLSAGGGDTQNEQFVQQEISRMASENLAMQERIDELVAECEQYKQKVQVLMKKLKDLGIDDTADASLLAGKDMSQSMRERDTSILPVVRKKERDDYMGMFEYKSGSEPIIMQRLICELSPRTAVILLPGLPAYIVFMCIRYTDHMNDENKVRVLLKGFINGVKKVIRRRGDKMDVSILWLSNTLRLLHCLKQYSGDSAYQDNNTPIQNEQCLRNFDLSEYRQVLSDIAVWIYRSLITVVEQHIQQVIIPGLLEYEEISGVSGSTPRGRALSSSGTEASTAGGAATPGGVHRSPQHLTKEFTYIKSTLSYYGVDPDLIVQIFRQVFYFVCATCLNQLLLRRDLCRWSKGMQIRYNLSYLEVWAKENFNQQEHTTILTTLNPIIQAVYLLQARKSPDDVQSTCDMCPDLTPMQICKILNLYTPAEDFEPKITTEFIKQIQVCLQERDKNKQTADHNNLLMDSKYNFAVKFPFCPSTIRLEHIDIPESLNLTPLLTKI